MDSQRKHPLAKCEECPLYEGTKYVPSSGPERATLALVGEAPGVQESKSGKQFSGPSGQLLDIVLRHHGIDREDALLTNATCCRPPDGSPPPKSAILACRPRLDSELSGRGVELAVAMGNGACESLLGQQGVTKLRVGPAKPHRSLPSVRVIPTLNPAAALRQADSFPYIVTDIGKVVASHGEWTDPIFVVADTEVDALSLLDEVERRTVQASDGGVGILAVDIEVDVEKDIAFDHPNQYGMLCVGIGYASSRVLILGEGVMGSERVRLRLGELLRTRRITTQNGKFDCAGLYPVVGNIDVWFDTMLASYVFDERSGIHGLKYQAVEFLGAPQYDDEIKQYVGPGVGYGAIPRPKLYKYCATDVAATWALMELYIAKFNLPANAGLREVHDRLVRAANELKFVELNGIAIDKPYLNELETMYLESLGKMRETINALPLGQHYDKAGGLNPNSPMQVKKFFADHGLKVKDTQEDTIDWVIEKKDTIFSKVDPIVFDYLDEHQRFKKESKAYGTYVKGIRKRLYRGRVYPTFLLHGTTTGRLSCRNPNLQNIPRDSALRRMFVPSKPENVFVQTDYSQAELRVLSYLAGDSYFRRIFNDGEIDIFDDLTPIVFPATAELGKSGMDAAAWKELRVRVKAYVYGLAYGRTAQGLAAEYGFSVAEAITARNNFFSVIPEIVTFLEQIRLDVRAGKDLVTPWGRRRRFMLITKENMGDVFNQAQAFMPQSTASDMCLTAMIEVRKKGKGLGHIRNIVHDSILFECHEDDAEEAKALMEYEMEAAGKLIVGDFVKMAVDSKIGRNWGEV